MKRMTWSEIQQEYPEQYVYLRDVEWDEDNETAVVSAVVAHASREPDIDYLLRTVDGDFEEFYTAPGATLQLGALMV